MLPFDVSKMTMVTGSVVATNLINTSQRHCDLERESEREMHYFEKTFIPHSKH